MSYNYPDEGEEIVPGGKWKPPPNPLPIRSDLSMAGVAGQFNPATGSFGSVSPDLIAALKMAKATQQDQLLLNDAMTRYKPPGAADELPPGRNRVGLGGNGPGQHRWTGGERWGR